MPRPRRYAPAGEIFHVVNGGTEKRTIFSEDADYQCFIDLLDKSRAHASVTVVGYCLMGTHYHLMLRPESDDALSAYMHRVGSRYACYLREQTATVGWGHVFKERYWAKGMRNHFHLLTALAYVEGNAVGSGLVPRAEDWPWGSLYERVRYNRALIDPRAVSLPPDWRACVNLPRQRRYQELMRRMLWFPRPNR
jgi:putative transposase